MTIRGSRAAALLATGALAAALLAPTAAWAADKAQDVFIRNTDSDPVPTRQIGTSDVTVTNTPAVTLAGTPDVAMAGEPVYQRHVIVMSGAGGRAFGYSEYFTVPAGKRLRIDYVSFHDQGHASSVDELAVQVLRVQETRTEHRLQRHYISTSRQGEHGDVASEQVAVYVEPGDKIRFALELDTETDNTRDAQFTGVLLNV